MNLKQLKPVKATFLKPLKNEKFSLLKKSKRKTHDFIRKNFFSFSHHYLVSNRIMKLNNGVNPSSFNCSRNFIRCGSKEPIIKNNLNAELNKHFSLLFIRNSKKRFLRSTTNFENENQEQISIKQKHEKNNEMISHPLKKKKTSKSPEEFYLEKAKSFYSSYSKLYEINQITINLASPERIRYWAEKILPNQKIIGRVTNANTLHYKSFKPQKGGLFCERIFGPLKDFECACGKNQKKVQRKSVQNPKADLKKINLLPLLTNLVSKANQVSSADSNNEKTFATTNPLTIKKTSNKTNETYEEELQKTEERKFCPECDVEYTWSVMRRYQLGYIQLIAPVTHLWYLKGTPSYLSLLLNIKKKDLEAIIYCSESMTLEAAWNHKFILSESPSNLFLSWQKLIKSEDGQKTSFPTPFGNAKTKTHPIATSNKFLQMQSHSNNQLERENSTNQIHSFSTNPEKLNFVKDSTNILYIPQSIYLRKRFQKNLLPQRLTNWRFFTKPYFALSLNSRLISFVRASNDTLMANLNSKNQDLILFNNQFPQKSSFSNKTTKWILNAKNLPIPLYTLSKLEYLGQKEVLSIFVQRCWKVFYKKSYVLAYKKAIQIYKKSLISSTFDFRETKENNFQTKLFSHLEKWKEIIRPQKQVTTSPKHKQRQPNKTKKPILLKKQSFLGRLYFVKQKLKFIPLKIKPTSLEVFASKKTKRNEIKFFLFLKMIKFYFKKSVLKFLANFNYLPNLKRIHFKNLNTKNLGLLQSNYLSTKILHHSRYLIPLLSNEITKQIIKLLLKADLKQKILNDVLVKTALDLQSIPDTEKNDSFGRATDKASTLLPLAYVASLTKSTSRSLKSSKQSQKCVKKLNPPAKTFLRNKQIKTNLIPLKNYSSIKELMTKTVYKKNLLINGSITLFEVNSLSNIYEKPKIFSNTLKTKIFNLKKKNLQAYHLAQEADLKTNSNKELFYKSLMKQRKTSKSKFALNSKANNSLRGYQVDTENQPRSKIWKRRTQFKNIYSPKVPLSSKGEITNVVENKNIFNNIYSLAHTFNWKKEKDWRAFFFYISASPNYEDNPIFYYRNRVPNSDTPSLVGAGIIQKLLTEYHVEELKKMDKQNRIQLYEFTQELNELKKFVRLGLADKLDEFRYKEIFQTRNKLIRRLKLTRVLYQKKSDPKSMILSTLPVLPPDLRPIIKIEGQIAASDLNRFYQRILYRNERLRKFLKDPSTRYSYEMKFTQRLLQESVDNLISNGKGKVAAEKDSRGRPLKSLSDILKGKEGRFRQHLLGKRVDYSGRSVIVVGPKLKIHQCGLPKEMALELFLPFLLKRLMHSKMARTIIGAKTIIQTNPTLTLEILKDVMQNHPILLNRAPTLHRLGIQAFQAKLVEGRAILLHPLVCPAFNADFDGDQMAVHVPITVEARAEAWKLMFSRGNLLSPATGDPILLPSQDMVLGCYYLTTESLKYQQLSNLYFSNIQQVMRAYYHGTLPQKMHLHSIIWLKYPVNSMTNEQKQLGSFKGQAKQKFSSESTFGVQKTRNQDLQTFKIQRTKNKKQEIGKIVPNFKSSIDIFENDHDNEEPIEIRIEKKGYWKEISKKMQQRFDKNNQLISRYIRTTVGRIIFNLIIQDCIR